MAGLRQDVLTGRWVVAAPNREGRPNEYPIGRAESTGRVVCPFCPGHEAMTTPETAVWGRSPDALPDGPGWRIRCFPNRYPAVGPSGHTAASGRSELWPEGPASGAHEVVVCGPDHHLDLADLPVDHLGALLQLVQARAIHLAARNPGHFVLPFMNQGAAAGATLEHPHLQILALPRTPPAVADMTGRLARHRGRAGTCLACDLIEAERRCGERVVVVDADWLALAPWASRFPFEVTFWPRRHRRQLAEATGAELSGLAVLLKEVLIRQRRRHGEHAYNLVLLGGPAETREEQEGLDTHSANHENDYHWHLSLTPRLVRMAGFETGSGIFINSVLPELAAAELRAAGGGI